MLWIVINSAWTVIFVSCIVNPCEIIVHAQEKKNKTEKHKTWTQDSVESKRTLYVKENKPQQLISLYIYGLKGILVKCYWCPILRILIQKPMRKKAQGKVRPKDTPRRSKSKKGPKKEVQGKGICSRIQICRRIQFFGRMASADKDKLGPRHFWSSQHYLARKGPNSFV